MFRSLLVAALALSLSGCIYVRRSPSLDPANVRPATVTHASISTEDTSSSSGDVGIINAAIEGAAALHANSRLGEFGEQLVVQIAPWLEKQGFQLLWDPPRAKSLDKFSPFRIANDYTTLTGMWVEPRGSHWHFGNNLFREAHFKEVATVLQGDGTEAFVTIRTSTGEGGFFLRAPTMTVEVVVIDGTGKMLLDARGFGEGNGAFFLPNREPTNLSLALSRAIESLDRAKPELLKE